MILSTLLYTSVSLAETLAERSLAQLRKTPPASAVAFDFIVIADTRSAKPVGLPAVFKQSMREFNVHRPAFVVDIGDLILGGAAEGLAPQWDEFLEVVSACEVPFFPVVGNHDVSDTATREWEWGLTLTSTGPEVFLYRGVDRSRETVNTIVQLAINQQDDGRHTVYEAAFPKSELTTPDEVPKPFIAQAGAHIYLSITMNDLDPEGPNSDRHWSELTPGAGSGNKGFPMLKVVLKE